MNQSVFGFTYFQNQLPDINAYCFLSKTQRKPANNNVFTGNKSKDFLYVLQETKPDIYIFHSPLLDYNFYYKILLERNIPYNIQTRGKSDFSLFQRQGYDQLLSSGFGKHLKLFAENAHKIIYNNEHERKHSVLNPLNENYIYITNGINKTNEEIKKEETDDIYLYHLSRIDFYQKNLDSVLNALSSINLPENIKIRFYGKGKKSEINRLTNKIAEIKHLDIDYNGYISGEHKKTLLQKPGILILNSRYEGWPHSILESWKYGNPILVSEGTHFGDLVREKNTGWLIEPDKVGESILTAIESYQENKNKYFETCRKTVLDYELKDIAEQAINQYL